MAANNEHVGGPTNADAVVDADPALASPRTGATATPAQIADLARRLAPTIAKRLRRDTGKIPDDAGLHLLAESGKLGERTSEGRDAMVEALRAIRDRVIAVEVPDIDVEMIEGPRL